MSDPANGEWNEEIVVQDNMDMRGVIVSDNKADQTTRQGGVRCKNIDFWKNVRAGTIIGIWHRNYPTNTPADSDANMADGRIMLAAMDTNYFEQIDFVSGQTWTFNAFNLSRTGDFIEVFTKDTIHIHAIGHKDDTAPGTYWFKMPAPKTNVLSLCEDKSSNRVYPGSTLAEYNGPNQEVRSQACSQYVTRTLPNRDCKTGASNVAFWHSLRQPTWTAPSLQSTINASQVQLRWNAMTDPNPGDGIQGYLIVRDSGTTPFQPVDGRIYKTNERVGNAVVLNNLSSSGTSYTDNVDLPCGVIYTYRVFAYRFAQDDEYGVNTAASTARGRQYNRDNVAFHEVFKDVGVGPSLQTTGSTHFCEGSTVTLRVPAQPGYTAQWTLNGTDIAGQTDTSITVSTSGQYRLRLKNTQGCIVVSDSVDVVVNPTPQVNIYPTSISLCKDSTVLLQSSPNPDYHYQWQLNGSDISGATDAVYLANQAGTFAVRVTNIATGCTGNSPSVVVKTLNPSFSVSTPSITFGDLADCVSFADDANSLQVRNTSTSDTLTLTPLESTHFRIVSPGFPLVIPPGQSVNVVVRFTPTGAGLVNESISFVSNPCGISHSVQLSANKPNAGAGVTTDASTKDFGTVAWCQSQTVDDSVLVSVTQNTTFSTISVASPFSVSAADKNGFSLNAGQQRWIHISFNSNGNPVQKGNADLVLKFVAGVCSDSIKIALRGRYTLPQLLTDISHVDFGTLDSCSTLVRDTVINVTNTSSMDIQLQQFTGTDVSIVEITSPAGLTIPAGATVPITLRYAPTGYSALVNQFTAFVAKPCLDVSGLYLSGQRAGAQLSAVQNTIDFGDISLCNGAQANPQILDLVVAGLNTTQVTVSDVRFSNAFFLSSLSSGQTLNVGTTHVILNIDPNAAVPSGSFSETMYITIQPCDVQQVVTITGRFVGQQVSLANSNAKDTVLEFGSVDLQTTQFRILKITNSSSFAISTDALVSQVGSFAIAMQPPGTTIGAGETVTLTISYNPTTVGDESQLFAFPVVSPCHDTILVHLHGIGRTTGTNPIPFHFHIGNYTAQVGDNVSIPIDIVGTGIAGAALSSLQTDFDFNTSLLNITNVVIGPALQGFTSSMSSVQNGIRISATNGTQIGGEGVAFTVYAKVLLGNALATPLYIDTNSTVLNSPLLQAEIPQNGSLTIEGSCKIGNRLVKVDGQVGLMILSLSHDGVATFAYETVGEQWTTIDFYNSVGERVLSPLHQVCTAGVHELVVPTNALAQGGYYVIMHSGISTHTLLISLVR